MSASNIPATERQCYAILRLFGYDARGTLLTMNRAHSLIDNGKRGEFLEDDIKELERVGAPKIHERKYSPNSGFGFRVIWDRAIDDAQKIIPKRIKSTSLIIVPATKAFPKWALKMKLAHKIKGKAGAIIDFPSVEYATRFKEVLAYYGIDCKILED